MRATCFQGLCGIHIGSSSGQSANISGYGHQSGRTSVCGSVGIPGRITQPSWLVQGPARPRRAERGGDTSRQVYWPTSMSCSMKTEAACRSLIGRSGRVVATRRSVRGQERDWCRRIRLVSPVQVRVLGRGALADQGVEHRLREQVVQPGKVHCGQSTERGQNVIVVLVEKRTKSLASGRSSTTTRRSRRRLGLGSRRLGRGRLVRATGSRRGRWTVRSGRRTGRRKARLRTGHDVPQRLVVYNAGVQS